MSTIDRRGAPRTRLDMPLNLTLGDETLTCRLRDISSSGIRFRSSRPLPLMSRVQLALELPSLGGNPLPISGVVVRSDLPEDLAADEGGESNPVDSAEDCPYDTAIFFDDLSDKVHAQLMRFLASTE